MVRDEAAGGGGYRTRRDVLRTLGAGGAVALAGCDGDGTTPTEAQTVEFLLATSTSGEYGRVGTHQQHGFQLAIDHINEGGGLVDAAFDDLGGDGLLGREVEAVTEDTENSAETARSTADRFLSGDGVAMVAGGVSGAVTSALSEAATEHDVPYMAGTAPNPEITGSQCTARTFRVQPHAGAIAEALGDVLAEEFPERATYVQVSTRTSEGQVLADAVGGYFNRTQTPNWQARGRESVRPGSGALEETIRSATTNRPDVIVLNLFGLDAISGLQAVRDVRGDEVGVVIPLLDDSLGRAIGEGMEGVLGTVPWDAGVGGERSTAYDDSYVGEYGRATGGSARTGSGTAHVVYTETLLYAAAAERAGSLDPDAVTGELEGATYEVGLGEEQLRACDHQATRPVPVVRGISAAVAERNHLEVVSVAGDILGSCEDPPASDCST